jgi:signal transduction histidine kinase/DNA-binding response OmpR family regulator
VKTRLLAVAIERETDIVLVRDRTRLLARLLGFDIQDQTRIATAVSEIVRNAWDYGGGGRIEYWVEGDGPQTLEIVVRDEGKGIADIDAILSGSYRSATGMGLGVLGARRLMSSFAIETAPGRGTTVRMGKPLPRREAPITKRDLGRLAQSLTAGPGADPLNEVRRQNQEMLVQLEELQRQQQALTQLNQELQDTNRGVVALYAELDERADHLRRADELKSRFLSNMSHEFRTPLNSILALARLLLSRVDGMLTSEQERQVQYIRKAAETLSELVNDLLDIAKVEAGKTVVTPSEFTAASLFGALRGMLRPLLVGDAVAFITEEAADVPALFTDEGKVSQILRNFVSNAIKFTERGEVRLWAQYEPDGDSVVFAVRDTGIGIAAEDIDLIWQEFSQLSHPLQKKVKGTGLGLPLSKKLAELLGGRISVESAPGQGSVFRLTLPRVYRQPGAAAESEIEWAAEAGRVPVLAIEDDPADAFALERTLASSRYQPVLVRSLAQARRALQRISPVAVLLDIILVGEEGWRFLLELKQQPATETIPVIVVSTTQEERKARSLGADEYFSKPVEPARLIAALDALTGERSLTRVLVIDDDEVSRYLVRQLLPRGAFQLSEASTGEDGLRRLHEDRPDVVLLDLTMPGMDGFAFLDRLSRGNGSRAAAAVVLTSTSLTAEQRQRLLPAARILAKSELSADALVAAIRDARGTREAGPA